MNIADIQKHFSTGDFESFYIFTGEDIGLMNSYISKMSNKYGGQIIRADTLLEVWKNLTQRSLFKTLEKNIYVVRDDLDVKKREKLWSRFSSITNGILILIYSDFPNNLKMRKVLEGNVVEFNHLTVPQLVNYIMHKCSYMDRGSAEHLVTVCESDLGRIDNELFKIGQLEIKEDTSMIQLIDDLVYSTPTFNVFDVMDAILQKDNKVVVEGLNLATDPRGGINRMGFLTILYNTFNTAARVMGNVWDKDIEKRSGIQYFKAKNIWQKCKYTQASCINAMKLVQQVESGIKSGRYNEFQGVKMCILQILSMK